MSAVLAVEAANLVKSYPGVTALDNVSLAVRSGVIAAVVGENGAGKSTLMTILAGLQSPDAGTVHVSGKKVTHFDPHTLLSDHGVVLVPQELTLCRERTVAENVLLGVEPSTGPFPSRRRMRQRAAQLLADLDRNVDPDQLVGRLPIAEQQLVVIARALARDCRVLILDEPTAVLTPGESEHLFALLRRLRASGTTIIYVSHRIPEIFELADDIYVMRDGQLLQSWPKDEVTPGAIVRTMVGRELEEHVATPVTGGNVLYRVRDLSETAFHDISFELVQGEILGIAGLPGSGRSELLGTLFGTPAPRGGTTELEGRALRIGSPADAIRARIAYVPAERRAQGILSTMDVAANLAALELDRFSRFGFVNWRALRQQAAAYSAQFRVKCRDNEQGIQELSGGNQQKVLLARWMAIHPRLLLLDEPTRGIDVGAKAEIYDLLSELAAQGRGIILSSSDLPELLRVCHRIAVMCRGKLVAMLSQEEATEQRIMAFATGVKEHVG